MGICWHKLFCGLLLWWLLNKYTILLINYLQQIPQSINLALPTNRIKSIFLPILFDTKFKIKFPINLTLPTNSLQIHLNTFYCPNINRINRNNNPPHIIPKPPNSIPNNRIPRKLSNTNPHIIILYINIPTISWTYISKETYFSWFIYTICFMDEKIYKWIYFVLFWQIWTIVSKESWEGGVLYIGWWL